MDTFVADKLGSELQAGSWSQTEGMGTEEMSVWYLDFLNTIHSIGEANEELIASLRTLDEQTGPGEHHARLRGLPKIMDKILWWVGREERRGCAIRIFRG